MADKDLGSIHMVEEKNSDVAATPPVAGTDNGQDLAVDAEPKEERTTAKAWLCIAFLTLSFGAPFWAVPTTAAISAQLLTSLGSAELAAWVIPSVTTAATVTILLFGVTSDLFGRRNFLLLSCVFGAVGYIVCARATTTGMLIGGLVLLGCAGGVSGVALIAVPELIVNKYRHIGVVLADAIVYIFIIIGPVVGRYTIIGGGEKWRWLYWAGMIAQVITFVGLACLYFPPAHPRGIPYGEALRGLDWIGGFLFTAGAVPVLVGIVNTTYMNSTDPRVLAPLLGGLAFIIAFGFWETFAKIKYPFCPREIFASHKGREFTVPFCLTFIVVGFFYSCSIIYPTMLNAFYIDATTPVSTQLLLTLPSTVPLPVGALILTYFGRKIGHWKWTMLGSVVSMVLWGALLALITPYNKGMMIAFVALNQLSYGWAAYLSVTYTQLGVSQENLGISGGLAGTARYAGGAVASAAFSSAINHGIISHLPKLVPAAALAAGLPESLLEQVVAAASSGAAALQAIPGVSDDVVVAVTDAYKWCVAYGLRNAAFASLAFGVVGIVLCFFLEDITPKMNDKIEIFLENDALADKNKYH
ncbi:hypothetical protein SBRCBS47491_009653 [Sporothrix bragantina]|uniref:Major facilitator superfamily (MFS) profile domain-containing protein n=1 Tax=Sporothrix bragantina TaxID=671064 RepID=A0ABP0CWM9_9PEZI